MNVPIVTTTAVPVDEFTARWNKWFAASFEALMAPHVASINAVLEDAAGAVTDLVEWNSDLQREARVLFREDRQKICELVEICQLLAADDPFISGRLAQIDRDIKEKRRIAQQKTVEKQMSEQQRGSTVQEVVNVIDSILAH